MSWFSCIENFIASLLISITCRSQFRSMTCFVTYIIPQKHSYTWKSYKLFPPPHTQPQCELATAHHSTDLISWLTIFYPLMLFYEGHWFQQIAVIRRESFLTTQDCFMQWKWTSMLCPTALYKISWASFQAEDIRLLDRGVKQKVIKLLQ